MEDVLLRFGHIGLEIFLSLDIQSLTKCQEASRSWKTFIDNEKIAPFKIINEKTKIPTKNVWKAIRESSLESAIKLANEVNFVYNGETCGETPLRTAAFSGKFAACKLIIENVEDKNPIGHSSGRNLLHDLARQSNLAYNCRDSKTAAESYQLIMKYVEDKNPANADESGETPLHEAAELDSFEVCQVIVKNVDEKNPKDDKGITPFCLAAKRGNFKICYLIIDNLKAEDIPKLFLSGWTQLHIDAIYGNLKTFREMIEKDGNINPVASFGTTPFYLAAGYGHSDICELIIKELENKNPKCYSGYTPLHMAAKHGRLEVCQLIFQNFDKSQNFNPSNDEGGDTPLSLAAENGFTDVCKLILENIEDKNPEDNIGLTPYHYAAQNGNLTLCQLIAKDLEDKNPKTMDSGWTPLHTAAQCGQLEVYQFIFEIVQDKQPKTYDGRTPLDIAVQFKQLEIGQFILSSKDSMNHLLSCKFLSKNEN